MDDREKPSLAVRILAPVFFILGALSALAWFFLRVFDLFFGDLISIKVVEKGAFYLFGVGIGLVILALVTVKEGWIGKALSKRQAAYFTRAAYIAIISIFTVPHLVHYAANTFLLGNGYEVCEEAGHQWLFVRDIVYIKPSVVCSEEIGTR